MKDIIEAMRPEGSARTNTNPEIITHKNGGVDLYLDKNEEVALREHLRLYLEQFAKISHPPEAGLPWMASISILQTVEHRGTTREEAIAAVVGSLIQGKAHTDRAGRPVAFVLKFFRWLDI